MKPVTKYCSTYCYTACKAHNYILSPFVASLLSGAIFSYSIKNFIETKLLYTNRMNEEIIIRLKKIETKED